MVRQFTVALLASVMAWQAAHATFHGNLTIADQGICIPTHAFNNETLREPVRSGDERMGQSGELPGAIWTACGVLHAISTCSDFMTSRRAGRVLAFSPHNIVRFVGREVTMFLLAAGSMTFPRNGKYLELFNLKRIINQSFYEAYWSGYISTFLYGVAGVAVLVNPAGDSISQEQIIEIFNKYDAFKELPSFLDPQRPGVDFTSKEYGFAGGLLQGLPNKMEEYLKGLQLIFSAERAQSILDAISSFDFQNQSE